MGSWTHGGWGNSFSGDVDFGTDSIIDDYNDLRLKWFDWTLKGLRTEFSDSPPVRIFVMGTGDGKINYAGRINHGGYWRHEETWPLPATEFIPYYLHANGSLSPNSPNSPDSKVPSCFTFDPKDPVPTIGGGISAADPIMRPGAFDQRGRSDFFGCKDTLPLGARSDVLPFETSSLENAIEISGSITVKLWASSSAKDTDFTAKLIDVYPPSADHPDGLAMNLSDSIIRARYRNSWEKAELLEPGHIYEFTFELYPTSNVFKAGHRIRLDISSSNFPRFDVNPNTGGALGKERRFEIAHQSIYHDKEHPSQVILPVIQKR